MSRKLLSDSLPSIHGKKMVKTAIFYLNFALFLTFLQTLQPHLCSKRGNLGFFWWTTHRRPDDEPFFNFGVSVWYYSNTNTSKNNNTNTINNISINY